MSKLFSPKMPAVPEPIKPPTVDDTRQAEEDLMRLRRRRGRASTFLTNQRGRPTSGAASMLLGSGVSQGSGAYTSDGGGGMPRLGGTSRTEQ